MSKLALKDYVPPDPVPLPSPLTKAQKNKVKARVKTILGDSAMERRKVIRATVYQCNREDGLIVNSAMVEEVVVQMGVDGEFAPGYGSLVVPEHEIDSEPVVEKP